MGREPIKSDNGIRVYSEKVFVEMSQEYSKWHGSIVVKHVSGACVYVIPITNGAKESFFKEEFPSFKFRMKIIYMEFVGVYLKLGLSGSRNDDVLSDEVMLRAKETTIRMIIKRV
ncbi:hypothetical protein Tco_1077232 [Tanacetum coccineum]